LTASVPINVVSSNPAGINQRMRAVRLVVRRPP
jgi:hypothetical protein